MNHCRHWMFCTGFYQEYDTDHCKGGSKKEKKKESKISPKMSQNRLDNEKFNNSSAVWYFSIGAYSPLHENKKERITAIISHIHYNEHARRTLLSFLNITKKLKPVASFPPCLPDAGLPWLCQRACAGHPLASGTHCRWLGTPRCSCPLAKPVTNPSVVGTMTLALDQMESAMLYHSLSHRHHYRPPPPPSHSNLNTTHLLTDVLILRLGLFFFFLKSHAEFSAYYSVTVSVSTSLISY